MFETFFRLLIIITFNLIVSHSLYAQVPQKQLNFPIKIEALLKGEIHYYFSLLTPDEMRQRHPDLTELDSLKLLKSKTTKMLLTKTVYVVKKPVGFFDDKQLTDEAYLKHILGQRIQKITPDTFRVTVPGVVEYQLQSFFDADDVSTLPNSRVTRGVTAAKHLDVISQSASTIEFKELTKFNRHSIGAVAVSSFIPLKENQTLIIQYQLTGITNDFAHEKYLKSDYLQEVKTVRKLIENFPEQK